MYMKDPTLSQEILGDKHALLSRSAGSREKNATLIICLFLPLNGFQTITKSRLDLSLPYFQEQLKYSLNEFIIGCGCILECFGLGG